MNDMVLHVRRHVGTVVVFQESLKLTAVAWCYHLQQVALLSHAYWMSLDL